MKNNVISKTVKFFGQNKTINAIFKKFADGGLNY